MTRTKKGNKNTPRIQLRTSVDFNKEQEVKITGLVGSSKII